MKEEYERIKRLKERRLKSKEKYIFNEEGLILGAYDSRGSKVPGDEDTGIGWDKRVIDPKLKQEYLWNQEGVVVGVYDPKRNVWHWDGEIEKRSQRN